GAGSGHAEFQVDCPSFSLDIAPDATEVFAGESIGTTFSITNDGELDTPVYFVGVLPNDEGLEWSGDLPDVCDIEDTGEFNGLGLACYDLIIPAGETRELHVTSPTSAEACG